MAGAGQTGENAGSMMAAPHVRGNFTSRGQAPSSGSKAIPRVARASVKLALARASSTKMTRAPKVPVGKFPNIKPVKLAAAKIPPLRLPKGL